MVCENTPTIFPTDQAKSSHGHICPCTDMLMNVSNCTGNFVDGWVEPVSLHYRLYIYTLFSVYTQSLHSFVCIHCFTLSYTVCIQSYYIGFVYVEIQFVYILLFMNNQHLYGTLHPAMGRWNFFLQCMITFKPVFSLLL